MFLAYLYGMGAVYTALQSEKRLSKQPVLKQKMTKTQVLKVSFDDRNEFETGLYMKNVLKIVCFERRNRLKRLV